MPNSAQWFVFSSVCVVILWCLVASVLLILGSQLYKSQAIDEARERYAVTGAERVGAEAVAVLSAALAVRDSVDYAVQRKLYFEPMDYAAAKAALEPVFVALPSVRTVELAFIGRNESLMLRRRDGGQGEGSNSVVLVQSDADDCIALLGILGCLSAKPAREQQWYQLGAALPGGQEADGNDHYGTEFDAFRWVDHPGFVERTRNFTDGISGDDIFSTEASGLAKNFVAWDPSYALVFRSVFPGTGGSLSVIGRVTLEVASLDGNQRLEDMRRLGSMGRVFICDRGGVVLAAAEQGLQVLVQSPTGRIRFRNVWELREPWAKSLSLEDFAGGGERRFIAGGFQIVVAPLRGRGMGHFSVLTVAESGPFRDSTLDSLASASEAMVALPYPIGIALAVIYTVHKWIKRRRELKRVYPDSWQASWSSWRSQGSMDSTDNVSPPGAQRVFKRVSHSWGDMY